MGRSEEFLPALRLAFPADLRSVVPCTTLRQANCYYSSSDAAVPDRYAAEKFYKDIVSGHVTLEGGWRLYSSGGGITVRLVLEYLIGVRVEKTRIIFDPVLPKALDGMFVEICILTRHCRLVYRIAGSTGVGVSVVRVNGAELPLQKIRNEYRSPRDDPVALELQTFLKSLSSEQNTIELFLGSQ